MSTVKFGDYVTIQGTLLEYSQEQESKKQLNTVNGYLSAVGFTSHDIYLERIPKELFEGDSQRGNFPNFYGSKKPRRKLKENIASVRNYRDFVFQIWPKLDYDAHKKYQNLLDEERKLQNQVNKEDRNRPIEEDSVKQYLIEVQKKCLKSKERMEEEKENNMRQIHLFKGNDICYGQDIFLMHADSKQFVTGLVISSDTEKSGFKIQISNFFQKGMVFKFQPRYKLRKEGETIEYKDQIYILNSKQRSWINFSQITAVIDQPTKGGDILPNYYKSPDFKKHFQRQRTEAFLSNQNSVAWQLHFHSQYFSVEENQIRGGDLIYLYQTELQGNLTADYPYHNSVGNAEAYVRKYEGEYPQEKVSISSIWEVEIDQNSQRGDNIYVKDIHQEKNSNIAHSYKLRHFLTGKVLSSAIITLNDTEVLCPCLAKDEASHLEQESQVQFISTSGVVKEQMENNICYILKLDNEYITANTSTELISQNPERKIIETDDIKDFKDVTEEMIYKPIGDSELEIVRPSLVCLEKMGTEENSFQVIRLTEEEKSDVLFINSSKELLCKFLNKLRNFPKKEPVPRRDMLKKIVQVLSELIFFLVKTESKNPFQCEGIVNPIRQKMMKDFYFIELLTDILYYPFKLEIYKIQELDMVDSEIMKIFKLCNALMTHSIREYRPNEIYASQWLNLLIFQSEMTEGDCDIGSEETLTELIDNNEKILERIDEQTIKKFIKMLYDEKDTKYVKLVSALVICNGQAVSNQELISKMMLSNLEPNNDDIEEGEVVNVFDSSVKDSSLKTSGASQIIYNVKMQAGEVWIQNPLGDKKSYIRLIDLQNMSKESDHAKTKLNFVIEIVVLLSHLCKDRNYEAIVPLSRVFKRQTCFEIIRSNNFLPSLRKSFTLLVHSMYVDVSEMKKFILPNNIRAWTEIDKMNSIISIFDKVDETTLHFPQNKNIKYVQEKLKIFVLSYLSEVAKAKHMSTMNDEENKLTLSILNLAENIVDFGFFNTREQVQEILKNLFKLLNSTLDVTNLFEEENAKVVLKFLADKTLKGNINQMYKNKTGSNFERFHVRYDELEENFILQQCKVHCCKIIKKIILVRNDMIITEFVRSFKNSLLVELPSIKSKSKPTSVKKSLQYLDPEEKKKPTLNLELHHFKSQPVSQLIPEQKLLNVPEKIPLVSITSKGIDDYFNFSKSIEEENLKLKKSQSGKGALQSINQIFQSNLIKIRGCIKIDVIPILQDLSLYHSSEVVNTSFEILNLLFTERQTTLNLLSSLQLLESEESIKRYFLLKQIQSDLIEKVEKSESWLFKDGENATLESGQAANNLQQIVDLLAYSNSIQILSIQEEQSEPERENIPIYFDNKIMRFENEKLLPGILFEQDESINIKNQELIRNCYLHQQAIDLLRYDAHTYSRFRFNKEWKQEDFEGESIHFRILRLCYKTLGRFVCHNHHNQNLLMNTLSDFVYTHIRTIPFAYVNYLLEPLIQNNPLILINEDQCRKFVKEIIQAVKKIKQFSFSLAACYFDVLRRVPYLNDTVIKENQTLIVHELTNKANTQLLSCINVKDPSFTNLAKSIYNLQRDIDAGQQDVIIVPGDVDYFNSVVYLLATICEEKNNATESKAQNYLPLKILSDLFSQFQNCIYIKRHLYFFFFHVYLETEKEMTEDLLFIKKRIIYQTQEDLKQTASSLEAQGFSVMSYRGRISMFKLKMEYIFESLLLCVDSILFKKLLDQNQKQSFYASVYESIQILSKISLLQQLEKKKMKAILIQLVLKKFVTVSKLKETIQNSEIVPTIIETRQLQQNLYQTSATNKALPNKSEIVQGEKEGTKELVFASEVKALKQEQQFQADIKNDFRIFVDYFTNIKKISQQAFRGMCTIDFSELTSAMIHFMLKNQQESGEDKEILNQLQKKRLQVLRQIIELENRGESGSVDTWESVGQYGEEIKRRQDKLIQQGLIKMIVNEIKNADTPYDLKEEAILLGIALLFGGNVNSQQGFLEELTQDSKNMFLGTLFDLIQKGISVVKKNMSHFNKQSLNSQSILFNQENDQNIQNVNDGNIQSDDKLSDENFQGEGDEDNNFSQNIPQNVLDEMQKLCRVFRILQLFCEGHNNAMQNHLRQQIINGSESGKSIDFIFTSSLIFANIIKFINVHCVHLAVQVLDFLTEVIQGPCPENQMMMCRGKIIETCKDFQIRMQGTIETNKTFSILGFTNEEKKGQIDSLSNQTFNLLYSLIEGSASQEIFDMLCSTLDFQFLLKVLVQRYEEFKLAHKAKGDDILDLIDKIGNKFDERLSEVFDIYLLILTLSDKNPAIKEMLDIPTKEQKPALQFFKFNCASIEIVFQERLLRVYFPIQPICRLLSKSTRIEIMEEIPRATFGEKIEGLVECSADLFDEMEHQAYLKAQLFFFSSNRLDMLRIISYFISLIINFTILFSYRLEFLDYKMSKNQVDEEITSITSILGIIQFVITIVMATFWMFINAPLIFKKEWRKLVEENTVDKIKDEEVQIIEAKFLSLPDALSVLLTKGPEAQEFTKRGKRDFGHIFVFLFYYWRNFQTIMRQGMFIYMMFYVIVSAMGLYVSDIVYCLHLLDIIVRFPTLQNVIKALTTNIGQLGMTTLLGAVIIYVYTIFAFYYSDVTFNESDAYSADGSSDIENTCTTLFQCYLFTLNKGLVSGGGIGEGVKRPSYTDDTNTFVFRYLFDLSFFMIINITFLNFIFGIIVDTFAQLRDEKQQKEEDKRDVCFICGLSRDQFDQVPGGFTIHIETQHQLWYYVYFIYHLRTMDCTEYNGIESYIADLIHLKKISWFPSLRAISIGENGSESQDQETFINDQFDKIKNYLKDVHFKFDKFKQEQIKSALNSRFDEKQ